MPFFNVLGQVLAWDSSRDEAAPWEDNTPFNILSALAFVDQAFDSRTIGYVMASLSATIASVITISAQCRWFHRVRERITFKEIS